MIRRCPNHHVEHKGLYNFSIVRTNDLHILCNLLRLSERRRLHLLNYMYKYAQNLDNIVVPRRILRNKVYIKLKVNRPVLEQYRVSPLYRGMLAWNSLNVEAQHAPSLNIFRSKIAPAMI